jgi:hypothetical protein
MEFGKKITEFCFQSKKFKKRKSMSLQAYVIGKCNLNCVSCAAFAPIADGYTLDPVSFESDCKRLSELGGEKISGIALTGGEPLLHPRLGELMGMARLYFPAATLRIVTNGILLPKQKEHFWNCCKQNSAYITVTRYPIAYDVKSVKALADKYGVALRWNRDVRPWLKMALDLSGSGNPHKNYKKCRLFLQCPELRDGKIAACQTILKMGYFNGYFQKGLKVSDDDTIDIHKAKTMDEILEFISIPVRFCRYCGVKMPAIKWGLSKKEISEWI